jgi:hypothetical protein
MRKNREKSTKTDAVKHVPVHPVLAAMLTEWKLGGWSAMFGRASEPDDLIVPLPPDAAERRRSRTGDAYRGHDYTGKRWREEDLPALGWRYREPYTTKATFITLAIEDGARPEIIRDRVTHMKVRRSAFDGYERGPHWIETCGEVAKLQVTRRAQAVEVVELATGHATAGAISDGTCGGGGGSRIPLHLRSMTLRSWNPMHFAWSMVPRTPWSAADRSEMQRNRCRP